jgi:hypothetical protein
MEEKNRPIGTRCNLNSIKPNNLREIITSRPDALRIDRERIQRAEEQIAKEKRHLKAFEEFLKAVRHDPRNTPIDALENTAKGVLRILDMDSKDKLEKDAEKAADAHRLSEIIIEQSSPLSASSDSKTETGSGSATAVDTSQTGESNNEDNSE